MKVPLVWLVTGCSSGIGLALVEAILARGDKVIATARAKNGISGTERLSIFRQLGAAGLELDINSSEAKLCEIATDAWNIYGQVDVLVNNAGYMDASTTEEYNTEDLASILRTHVFGPLNLARAFLPRMRVRGTGTLLFSGAISPMIPGPGGSAYAGSKAMLDATVKKLGCEIEPFGLRCSTLLFGRFRTQLYSPGSYVTNGHRLPAYKEFDHLMQQILKEADGTQVGDPMKAAKLIVDAVRGEGRCEGKKLPARLPLGPDAFEYIRQHCEEMMRICDEWQDINSETSFPWEKE